MMKAFDFEIINSRIEKIRANLVDLRQIAKSAFAVYVSNSRDRAASERLLQTSIEAMLDIGSHIIAICGFEEPKEYRDIFLILGQRGVFEKKFTKKLLDLTGLRNRLVHMYLEIDDKKLYSFLKDNLDDFEEFIRIILRYMEKT